MEVMITSYDRAPAKEMMSERGMLRKRATHVAAGLMAPRVSGPDTDYGPHVSWPRYGFAAAPPTATEIFALSYTSAIHGAPRPFDIGARLRA